MRQVNGNYRLVLHPGADPAALEALLLADDPGFQLQLTRVTTSVRYDVHRVLGSERDFTRQYVLAASVTLISEGVPYDFDQNLERIQAGVKDFATVLGVEATEPLLTDPQPD
jgi:hypothetical protein